MDLLNKALPEEDDSISTPISSLFITSEDVICQIKELLNNFDQSKEKDLYNLVSKYYTNIFDETFENNNTDAFNVLMDYRVLSVLLKVFSATVIDDDYRIYCNKLCYDYLKYKNSKEERMERVLLKLSGLVNKDIIPGLLVIGVPEGYASHMALARYSSSEDIVNIKRLNRVLIHTTPELMTEQMIVDIYTRLFKHATPLLEGIMFDVLTEFWSDDEEIIYSTINLAILDILESMTTADICQTIKTYIGDKNLLYPDAKTRFNIKAISVGDYPRIISAIDYLEDVEKLYVY